MKIKLDENLPTTLVGLLTELGHDTDTVPQEGMAGKPDDAVWTVAQAAGRFFITQDLDFSNIHRFLPGTHEGLMLVRLHAPGRAALARRIHAVFQSESVDTWKRAFILVTDRKLRVRRAPEESP